MTPKIIPSNRSVVAEDGTPDNPVNKLTAARLRQLYDHSQHLIFKGIRFGWQQDLYQIAGLYNIKELELHWAEGLNWQQYVDQLPIDPRSVQRYLRIGRQMSTLSKDATPASEGLPFFFTEQSLKKMFEPIFTNGHTVTITGLYKASKDLDTFRAYLAGETIKEADAVKLLQEANTFSDKESERRSLTKFEDEDSDTTWHEDMERMASEMGFVWNRKKKDFFTTDGEPLSDEQKAEMVPPDKAMRLWRGLRQETATLVKRTHDLMTKEGRSYLLFAKHIPSTRFRQAVIEERERITGKIEILNLMTEALLEGDFDKAEVLFKKGVEE